MTTVPWLFLLQFVLFVPACVTPVRTGLSCSFRLFVHSQNGLLKTSWSVLPAMLFTHSSGNVPVPFPPLFLMLLQPVCVYFREAKVTEVKPKEVQLSVERVPGTLSTASKSVQVNGAATVSIDFSFSFIPSRSHCSLMLGPSRISQSQSNQYQYNQNIYCIFCNESWLDKSIFHLMDTERF